MMYLISVKKIVFFLFGKNSDERSENDSVWVKVGMFSKNIYFAELYNDQNNIEPEKKNC